MVSKEKPPTKFFDVSRPGKTAPSNSSRPAIVGHRTIMKDPMLNRASNEADAAARDDPSAAKITKIKLTPSDEAVADAQKAEVNEKAAEPPKVVKSVETEQAESLERADKNQTPQVAHEVPVNASVATPVKDETPVKHEAESTETDTAEMPADDKKLTDKKLEEEIAKQEALEMLVNDKTYFAPIGEKKLRRSRQNWFILGVLVLAVSGYSVLDAQIIKNNINLPVHVFKLKTAPLEQTVVNVAPVSLVTLPQSGLKLPIDTKIWTASPPSNSSRGVAVTIKADDSSKFNSTVYFSEYKKSTVPVVADASQYTHLGTEPITGSINGSLYFYHQVRKYTIDSGSKAGTFYAPECGVSDDAGGTNNKIPVNGKDYQITITCFIAPSSQIIPVRFSTEAEAEAWFNTSSEYKQFKTLLAGIKF
jgi:hypothetical protein